MRRERSADAAQGPESLVDFAQDLRPLEYGAMGAVAALNIRQAAIAVHVVISIASLVAHPPLVHVWVGARLETIDGVLIFFDVNRTARRAAGADAGMRVHEPHALLVQE